jgi:hypothetical protein
VAFCKLYDQKNTLAADDMLNDVVLPFFDSHEVPLLCILADRGSEYCGNREHHEYTLYLEVENMYCYGKTPMQTSIASIQLTNEKLICYAESDGQPA